MVGTWKQLKNEDQCPCCTRKTSKCTKKGTLGLTVGHGVIMSPCWSLWSLCCQKHSGTEASRRGKKWMGGCLPGMIENHDVRCSNVFLPLEEQNRFTAQAKRKFWHLSHTPANRHECPFCKHFLTHLTNTSILSLSLRNHNCKFITLTRAASQLVALF